MGTNEILLLVLIALLLFGATRLPTLARSMGRSLRIFKAETRGLREEGSESQEGGDTEDAARADTSSSGQSAPPSSSESTPGISRQLPAGHTVIEETGDTTHRPYGR
ncbi:twin-arginine translocase TatA/TatE family subunit [Lipingzhangella sp. LS1_29]|uniref:Sec-independent protein translocase protein TatA n=1 Tax=Lipingzhangella rawalii TaxID=2055835 RepID=A0ABU2H0X0_9ACTN|nr:twin-arginine translocase TatA/TatE family subunit [Lipingzhangella rawalii]MDS1268948.1 twin-arginine translocase TatA/TatE family subunit [Lipingzhangella rawalii]